jgi:TM2 domain-containing membrane protein YozV
MSETTMKSNSFTSDSRSDEPVASGPKVSNDGRFYMVDGRWVPIPSISTPQGPYQPQPKNKNAYILLALFLGGLGIHNFYAGRIGAAVAQLIITLFAGWLLFPLVIVAGWAIIEAFVVDTDGSGRKMA